MPRNTQRVLELFGQLKSLQAALRRARDELAAGGLEPAERRLVQQDVEQLRTLLIRTMGELVQEMRRFDEVDL